MVIQSNLADVSFVSEEQRRMSLNSPRILIEQTESFFQALAPEKAFSGVALFWQQTCIWLDHVDLLCNRSGIRI